MPDTWRNRWSGACRPGSGLAPAASCSMARESRRASSAACRRTSRRSASSRCSSSANRIAVESLRVSGTWARARVAPVRNRQRAARMVGARARSKGGLLIGVTQNEMRIILNKRLLNLFIGIRPVKQNSPQVPYSCPLGDPALATTLQIVVIVLLALAATGLGAGAVRLKRRLDRSEQDRRRAAD